MSWPFSVDKVLVVAFNAFLPVWLFLLGAPALWLFAVFRVACLMYKRLILITIPSSFLSIQLVPAGPSWQILASNVYEIFKAKTSQQLHLSSLFFSGLRICFCWHYCCCCRTYCGFFILPEIVVTGSGIMFSSLYRNLGA